MAELTPVTELNYNQFKNLYDSSKPYEDQNVALTGKFDKETFDTYSNIAEQEKELGFFDKFTGGLEKLFSASAAEPDIFTGGITTAPQSYNFKSMANKYEDSLKDNFDYSGLEDIKRRILNDENVPLNNPFEDYPDEQFDVDNEPIPFKDPFKPFQTMDYGNPPFSGLKPSGIMQQAPFGTEVDKYQGFTNDTPSTNFKFLQSANEDLDELSDIKNIQKARQSGGLQNILGNLVKFAVGGAFPGTGLLMNSGGLEGLRNLNSRLQNSEFGRSKTLKDYFENRKNRIAREEAQNNNNGGGEGGRSDNRGGATGPDRSGGTGGRRGGAGRYR